jgi:hypothetical protein
VTTICLCAIPAAAQVRSQAPVATPSDGRVFIGGIGGASAVQKIGGMVGGEVGVQVTDRVGVLAEGVWLQNVVTRRRLDVAQTVAVFLHASQGGAATSTIVAPAFYSGGAVRVEFPTHGRVHPYITGGAGMARIALRPTFTLGGADVTTNLAQYGVTLGTDLTGEVTKPAFSVGFGVRLTQARWYVDATIRMTSIHTEGQNTNVTRAGAGIGVRF